jgi:hypothetical protein
VPPRFRAAVASVLSRHTRLQSPLGQVLRDDYNPVDYFDAGERFALHRKLMQLVIDR